MEKAMEQLNRLTRSLRRARTVELPDGELGAGLGVLGAGLGEVGWENSAIAEQTPTHTFLGREGRGWEPRPPLARSSRREQLEVCRRGTGREGPAAERTRSDRISPDYGLGVLA